VLGAGPVWTRYGFRRLPYARMTTVRVLYAPLEEGVGVEALADLRRTGERGGVALRAGARTFDVVRFHDFGNESPGGAEEDYEVTYDEVVAEAMSFGPLWGGRAAYRAGPLVRWRDLRGGYRDLSGVTGAGGLAQVGAVGEVVADGRDTLPVTRSGWWARAGASAFAADEGGGFGGAEGEARAYLSLGAGPILALRAGGQWIGGDVPLQEAAFLGGYQSLRGYPFQRFAGDAAVFGSAEVRQPLGQVRLLIRGRVGAFGFAEAGRVYVDGSSPGDWHPSFGGGAWFESLGKVATVTWARGDVTRLYAGLGLPF
jgi:surface antigen Omp85-like protein